MFWDVNFYLDIFRRIWYGETFYPQSSDSTEALDFNHSYNSYNSFTFNRILLCANLLRSQGADRKNR